MSSGYSQPPQTGYGYAPQQYPTTPGAAPRRIRVRTIVIAIVAAIVLMVLLVAGIIAAVLGMIKSSEPYQHAVQVASRDSRVTAVLGSHFSPRWFLSGNIHVSGPSGSADLAIPVAGSQHQGTIYVVAKKSAGHWSYRTLELAVEGGEERINLLPASPQP
jgi:hypothetical protein